MIPAAASSEFPPRLQAYLAAILRMCAEEANQIVSLILFGSAATGGFSHEISDVDLILILRDDASQQIRRQVCERVTSLEILHGLREPIRRRGVLEALVEGSRQTIGRSSSARAATCSPEASREYCISGPRRRYSWTAS
jgi:predicted nucleotidyltransferase